MAFQGGHAWGSDMGSDLGTSGSIPLYLLGRYEQEGHKRATVENDFVVLKKVRDGVVAPPGS